MDREVRKWRWISAICSAVSPGLIIAIGQAGVFGPNPGTYFGLGILATGAIVGGAYAGRDAWRIARWRATLR